MASPQERAQRTIDAVFRTNGMAANYSPPGGGSTTPCTIMRAAPDEELGGNFHGAPFMQADKVAVRTVEVLAPVKDGTFTLVEGGDVITILSDPRSRDDFGLVWTMTVG